MKLTPDCHFFFRFLLQLTYGDNSLLLYSSNNHDAHGWIDDIKRAKNTLVDNEASLRRTSSVALEALAQTLPPNSSLTPYRYALRPRNKGKVFENVVVSGKYIIIFLQHEFCGSCIPGRKSPLMQNRNVRIAPELVAISGLHPGLHLWCVVL